MKQSERNFWLDVTLFLIILCTVLTGIFLWLLIPHQVSTLFWGFNRLFWLTAHIYSGLVGLVGIVIHIIWHREWLKALRKRPIASLPPKLRANRLTDRVAWIFFLIVVVFGIIDWLIPAFDNRASIFGRLHVAFGVAWMIGIIVHLALHARWITSAIKNNFLARKMNLFFYPDR